MPRYQSLLQMDSLARPGNRAELAQSSQVPVIQQGLFRHLHR